jgi:hypothetical protein
MKGCRMTKPLLALAVLAALVAGGAHTFAQQTQNLDPDKCGAAGRGCAPATEKKYMAIANRLAPDLPSYLIAQFASACASRPPLRAECERDPKAVLLKLGFPKEDIE